MKRSIVLLSLAVACPIAALRAQILAPNKAGVAMGHWHTIVRDVEATKKFYILLGGAPIKVDGTDVMKFPGILVFLTPGSPPSGGNSEAVIDHFGFNMLHGEEFLGKLKAAGIHVPPNVRNPRFGTIWGPDTGILTTPDGLRVVMKGSEFELSKRPLIGFSADNLNVPIASDYVESTLPESVMAEVQAWYVRVLGGTPLRVANEGRNYALDFPGARILLSPSHEAPFVRGPTKGRALDHIGFEVKNLAAYCKKLEAMGVKFDRPYSKSRHASFASAELTDPWGASIELTEGLNKF
jgi:catechol 2,3-dioxygenase-like lactoylglutathione lyase family enzyme